MNDLQRSLGRIEGNQEAFYKEWSGFRDSQEQKIVSIEAKVEKLNKFKNYATGAVGAILTALSVVTGLHIKTHP